MDALLTTLAASYNFTDSGRNAVDPDDVAEEKRPALYLVDSTRPYTRPVPQQPPKRELRATGLVYTTTKGDPTVNITGQVNDILDAFDGVLKPDNAMLGKFTIGSRVDSCVIDGDVLLGTDWKTGKCLMAVPFKIILP